MQKRPKINITIPVYNEEKSLDNNIRALHAFLINNLPYPFELVIIDNGSADGSFDIAKRLSLTLAGVKAVQIAQKGRGRALKHVWMSSDANVLSYMDVDLSTNLLHYPVLIDSIVNGNYDIAIGSRLTKGSRTTRGIKRELLSRGYNALLKLCFFNRFSDAQCGFKAISRDVARRILPLVKDTQWFFDSELLLIAEKLGYKIKEVSVEWIDDLDTRLNITKTVLADLMGILRLRFSLNRTINAQP